MQIWHGAQAVPAQLRERENGGSVATVGSFDGVHKGHQTILRRLVETAREMETDTGKRPLTVVVTFDPHPLHVHRPEMGLPLVTSLADRLESLEACGVDAVLVIHYTLEFAAQSPTEFVQNWLVDLLGVRAVVVGDDVRFGSGNSGTADELISLGERLGFETEILSDICSPEGRRWSSTWVRQCLAAGDVVGAAEILGRPHRLRGTVIHGLRRGRELGFPTANLQASTAGVVPPDGVYSGWLIRGGTWVKDDAVQEERLPAAISIGTNPTFDDVPERTVEAHVLGRSDLNLYGEDVAVELTSHLRPMLAFDGLDALLGQMRQDVVDTAQVLGVPVPEPIRPQDVTA